MASPVFGVGSLAFVGPPQIPDLTEFHYVRVLSVDGTQAKVALINPDEADRDFDGDVDIEVLRRRRVDQEESEMWPGAFVGHPVAFVKPDGPFMDQWSYGVVTGYRVVDKKPWLHLQLTDGTCKVALQLPSNVIQVDWINYALQTGAGTNVAMLNAAELLDQLNETAELCTKSRAANPPPPRVAKDLSIPFEPTALVPVIRPDTLAVVSASRQHVLDCSLQKKGKKGANLYNPPTAPSPAAVAGSASTGKRKAASAPAKRPCTRQKTQDDTLNDESDEEISPPLGDDDDDVRAVQQQNQPLIDGLHPDGPSNHAMASTEMRGQTASTFKPTAIEQRINDSIGHPDTQGKNAQIVLEYAQQARTNRFRATPPVLRGAWDFGFHVRGLSVLHFARVTESMLLDNATEAVNMSDFSRKNTLQPARTDPSYPDLLQALENLRHFGRTFYNADTLDVVEAVLQFIDDFADGGTPDRDTASRLALWVNMKLCKFRGLVLSDGLSAAIRVKDEFSLHDPLLSRLLYDQQQSKIADLTAQLAARSSPPSSATVRTAKPDKQGGVPKAVQQNLPKQGAHVICMKHLSKAGCSGNGTPGKCFSPKRAHFRPKTLPANVKAYISKTFGGLAPEYADL